MVKNTGAGHFIRALFECMKDEQEANRDLPDKTSTRSAFSRAIMIRYGRATPISTPSVL
jgi:hypothetical protein